MSIEQGAISVEAEAYLIRDARIYVDLEGRNESIEESIERLDQIKELFSSDLTDLQIIDLVESESEHSADIENRGEKVPERVEKNTEMLHTAIFVLPRIDTMRAIRLYNLALNSPGYPETASMVVNGLLNLSSINLDRKALDLWRKASNYPGNKASKWAKQYLKNPDVEANGLLDEPDIENLRVFGKKLREMRLEASLNPLEEADKDVNIDQGESSSSSETL